MSVQRACAKDVLSELLSTADGKVKQHTLKNYTIKKALPTQGTPISYELYGQDRKYPFGKVFKALVKVCCAKVDARISAKQMAETSSSDASPNPPSRGSTARCSADEQDELQLQPQPQPQPRRERQ